MRLLLIGCEYTGKSTLARNISRWMIETMGVSLVRWHDHFVVPRLDGHTIIRAEGSDASIGKTEHDLNTEEDEEQIMSLRPNVLEQLQRHNIWRHLHPRLLEVDDVLFVNFYYAEAVYAPLYHGYGEPDSFADRYERAREWDEELLAYAPDMVLAHVTADPAAVAQRMATRPRVRGILKQQDIPSVLDRFREEYEAGLIERKFTLDTTDTTPEQTLGQFVDLIRPHLSEVDRQRMR
ncbi:MAG: hypothetical protein F4W93_03965 [Dehalococcoidia bacterium]|nr:hypothetical protein [Dehalococcoidia bacterium]